MPRGFNETQKKEIADIVADIVNATPRKKETVTDGSGDNRNTEQPKPAEQPKPTEPESDSGGWFDWW